MSWIHFLTAGVILKIYHTVNRLRSFVTSSYSVILSFSHSVISPFFNIVTDWQRTVEQHQELQVCFADNNEDELMTHHYPPLHLAYTSGQSSPHQLLPPLTTPTAVYLNRHSITDKFGILSSTATNNQGEAPPILFELQSSAWISVSMSSAHSAQVEIPVKLYLVENKKPLIL